MKGLHLLLSLISLHAAALSFATTMSKREREKGLTDVQGAASSGLNLGLVLGGAWGIVLQVGDLGVWDVLLPHLHA